MDEKFTNKETSICSDNSEFSVPEKSCESQIKERCPLCYYFRFSFNCERCVSLGNFVSTTTENDSETFAMKRTKRVLLEEQREEVVHKCRKIIDSRTVLTRLPEEIDICNERIRTLRYLIQEKKDAIMKKQCQLSAVREKNKSREERLPRYRERVHRLASYVKNDMQAEIQQRRNKLEVKKQALKLLVRNNIHNLVQYIFPIKKINPTSKNHESDLDDTEIISALADASKTSFIKGTWVLMDSSGGLHHQIVAPTLPASGDYSVFMAVQNENAIPIVEKVGTNEAYNVAAALCYTSQLVNLLASYLDIILPKKVTYSDFTVRELTKRQFECKVASLNTNVLYLCFSQGLHSHQLSLNPKNTLSNLLNLVEDADLGQCGPFQVDSGLLLGVEWEAGEEGGSDSEEEGDQLPWEWEAIPLVACPEGAMTSTTATATSSSIAGGLVTSLASMFRGWSK